MASGDLTALKNVTVMLRLVVDTDGGVVHGSLVTLDGDVIGRVRALDEVVGLLGGWLADPTRSAEPEGDLDAEKDDP